MGYLRYSKAQVAPPGHNGGRSQTNFGFLYAAQGDQPFINVFKLSPMPTFADLSANTVTPDLLDSNGYPLATGSHGGYRWAAIIPPGSERPGNYIATWDGTGTTQFGGTTVLGAATFTGSITGTTLTISGLSGTIRPGQRVVGGTVLPYTFIMSGSGSTWTVSKSQSATGLTGANSGSAISSGGAGAGFVAFSVDDSTNGNIIFSIISVGSPIITNVQIFHVNDAAAQASGEIFGTEFLFRLREANFGVLRFLNWHDNNVSNMATWRTRKPVTYAIYLGDQLNNSFYAGTATHTSNAYVSSQFPAMHSSDGTAWTSGGPRDKDTVHVVYTNSATTSGTCSLSIGTSGVAINMLDQFGGPLSEFGSNGYPLAGTANGLSTLVYDATFGAWIMHGGNAQFSGVGIHNVVPPEVCVQLCKEVGAHPYFNAPYLSLDKAGDFMAELAQYCKTYAAANAPWMIPRFEGPNETWNGNTFMTGYANRKAVLNWGAGDFTDQYGKWMANLGQMCAAVYGGVAFSGVTYQTLCGVQTSIAPSSSNEKMASTKYVAQSAAADPAITGSFGTISFTKQAAKITTSHVVTAQYISGGARFTSSELPNGFAYSVTNKGNSSAQATLANAYCDSLADAVATYGNLAYFNVQYVAYKTWAASYGVNKMCGYEGCYSPDYMSFTSPGVSGSTEADAWWSAVTGRTQTNPAIIQLTSSCQSSEGGNPTGNPGAVGMAVTINSSSTQFDNPGLYTRPVTFTASSATISGTNTLVVNQAVFFRTQGGTFPIGLASSLQLTVNAFIYSETYYVVAATSTTFQISATRGGTAITFTTAGIGSFLAQEAWFVTAVDSVNNRITLDCNSTGFTTPTAGNLSYSKSMLYSNNLRYAGKMSPNLQGYTITNYNNFTAAGGEFPSNYLMGGPSLPSGNVWNLLEPLEQSPNPPQWLAIIAYNH